MRVNRLAVRLLGPIVFFVLVQWLLKTQFKAQLEQEKPPNFVQASQRHTYDMN